MRYLFIIYSFVLLQLMCGCQKNARDLNQSSNYTYVYTDSLQPQRVDYTQVNGMAVTEGDILLGTIEEVEQTRLEVEGKAVRKGAISIKSKSGFWPEGQVPYTIEDSLEDQKRATSAMLQIERSSHIRFIERTTEKDYVTFRHADNGCFATVGRRGGQQTINLEKNCSTGNTVHEIMHALGFWHEQSRSDRDKFIVIQWDNIKEEEKHNFEKQLNNGKDIGEYDYDSIMHYGPFSFSKNGKPTILKVDGSGTDIGNRSQLSKKDLLALNDLYPG